MRYELIIFDCDGVLVDSEALGTSVLVAMAAELGATFPLAEAVPLFRGVKMAGCVELIERRLGASVPPTFVADFRRRCSIVFGSQLRAIEGIEAVLDTISIPFCVASSSPMEKIELMLRLTGLLPRFSGRIFSADEVNAWKPDPALFLHVATRLGVSPAACAVVEDSLVGVQAGIAARMTTFGYADASYANLLAAEGAHVFHPMAELPHLLALEIPPAMAPDMRDVAVALA
jgi:HAD superfamily hydrolase (TIGR01509 family)